MILHLSINSNVERADMAIDILDKWVFLLVISNLGLVYTNLVKFKDNLEKWNLKL